MTSNYHAKSKSDPSTYQERDSAHFSTFNDQIKLKKNYTPTKESKPELAETSSFSYSKTDAQQFEKLLPPQTALRNTGKNRHRYNTPSSSDSGYSKTDSEQFEALMAFKINPVQTGHTDNTSSDAVQRSFQYNEKDLLAFGKMLPVTQLTDSSIANVNSDSPTRIDRDVGHIRIKKFDEGTANQRKQRREQNPNIKVRFFD